MTYIPPWRRCAACGGVRDGSLTSFTSHCDVASFQQQSAPASNFSSPWQPERRFTTSTNAKNLPTATCTSTNESTNDDEPCSVARLLARLKRNATQPAVGRLIFFALQCAGRVVRFPPTSRPRFGRVSLHSTKVVASVKRLRDRARFANEIRVYDAAGSPYICRRASVGARGRPRARRVGA
jgi:hypothetical protein